MSMTKVEPQTNMTIIEGMPLLKYCELIANTQLVPKNYQGKAADIFMAVKTGQDVGLNFLQSLKGIAVISGIPSIWGDTAMALVQVHPKFEDMEEYYDIKLDAAVCIIKRKGMTAHTTTFSMQDAKTAGLLGKDTWQKYPKRMLQMRARLTALKDRFSDALGGLILAEEAQDYPIDVTPSANDIFKEKLKGALTAQKASVNPTSTPDVTVIESSTSQVTEEEERATLAELIKVHNISEELISKWFAKEEINSWEELDIERVRKYIDFIPTKSNKPTDLNNQNQ